MIVKSLITWFVKKIQRITQYNKKITFFERVIISFNIIAKAIQIY